MDYGPTSFHMSSNSHIESDVQLCSFGGKVTSTQNRKSDGDSEDMILLDMYYMS